jgi:phosphoribosylanthranilate isomerase
MWIKVCGNTSLEDAQLAAESGADAVGFVFAPSPRRVTAERVAAITRALPPGLKKIGVFGEHSFDEIASIVRAAGLNGAQLHGGRDLDRVERLREEFGGELFLVQTLHWPLEGDFDEAEEKFRAQWRAIVCHNGVNAVLLDSKTATALGGTGRRFDWARARAILDDEHSAVRIIVAGGLDAGNVSEAVRAFKPWGVDVVSGTESTPGKKDPAKIRAFVAAARVAQSGLVAR